MIALHNHRCGSFFSQLQLFPFEINRTVNQCCCLKFMHVSILFFRHIFDEVHMFPISHFDGTGSLTAKFMEVLIREVSVEFYFVEMIPFISCVHCFSGYCAEPMVVAIATTFIEDPGAAG